MDAEESIRRAEELHAAQDAAEQQAEQQAETQSFDEFWSSLEQAETSRHETIRGVQVRVPTREQMTMRLRLYLDNIAGQRRVTTEAELHKVIGDLFGEGALEAFIDAGVTLDQLAVITAWGVAHAMGRPATWQQAHEQVMAGKAALANQRQSQGAGTSPGQSKNTGGRSRGGSRRRGGRRKR